LLRPFGQIRIQAECLTQFRLNLHANPSLKV
jgi:hypothetical protein